jgi:stearoyl-CoA desaturase (delta-9 desaturase)
MTFLINSAAHLWGTRPYTEANSARDSWWLGVFSFGEGYHNFHHKFQADYRNGIRWYQFDLTKWWLLAMRALGQARRLKQVPEPLILKAKLEIQMLHVERKLAAVQAPERMWERVQARLQAGRLRLESAYSDYQQAKSEYLRQKHVWSQDMRRQWHEKIEHYKIEMEEARRRWNELLRAFNRIAQPSAQSALSLAFVVDVLKYKLW